MKYGLRRAAQRLSCGRWISLRSLVSPTVRDVVQGRKFEYSLTGDIGRQLYLYGVFERNELELCRAYVRSKSTIVDIGANIGVHTVVFARMAKHGLVVSFEPQRAVFDTLNRNVHGLDNVVPLNLAISSCARVAEFHVASDDAYSSLKDTRRKEIVGRERVVTLPFDSFLQAFESIDLIKVDVEGLEYEVLLSMKKTLERYKPVLFVEIYSGTDSNETPGETVSWLQTMGYGAYVVDESGELQAYATHNDAFYNYFFIHNSRV